MQQMNLLEGLMSEEEVAEGLGMSRQWLSTQRRKGVGPPFLSFGSRIMYDVNDVNNWLAEQRRKPGPSRRGAPRKGTKESTDE